MNKRLNQALLFPVVGSTTLLCITGCTGGSSNETTTQATQTQPAKTVVSDRQETQQGNSIHHGGTPTIRKGFTRHVDDPSTTNDESNDQSLGYFGTTTITAHNMSSGNSYPLDADIENGQVQRIYFPKGGWLDFNDGEIDATGVGSGTDEEGNQWEFEGLASGEIMGGDTTAEEQEGAQNAEE